MGHEQDEEEYQSTGWKHFIFDPHNKTVLGRNAWSWFNVIIFYIGYYSMIAVISYYTILGYQDNMLVFPGEKNAAPRTNTRVATPGVATFPGVENMLIDSNRVQSFQYIDSINNRLMSLAADEENKDKLHQLGDCSPICSSDDGDEDCKHPPLRESYQQGNPCIFYQINKVIGWQPYSYFNLNQEGVTPRNSEGNSMVSEAVSDFDPKKVYLYCYDLDLVSGFTNATDRVTMKYYSYDDNTNSEKSYGFFNFNNWPLTNENNEFASKANPFIAVKVEVNPAYHGTLVNIACQTYAANLGANQDINEGIAVTSITIEKQGESSISMINEEFQD